MSAPAEIDRRRREVEQRLDASRHDLQVAVRDLRSAARRRIAPGQLVQRHPAALLGGAALFGLWLGARHGLRTSPSRTRRISR